MAKILKEFPVECAWEKYPWAEWLDGKVRALEPGKDFSVPPFNMRTYAYRAAQRYGRRLRCSTRDGGFIIQALPKK